VRTFLLTASPWLVGSAGGLIFGAAFAGVTQFTAPGPIQWQAAVIAGVVAGVLFGSALAYNCVRQQRDLRSAAGDLPRAQQLEALTAVSSGPIPTDPRIRAAAAGIARRKIDDLHQMRVFSAILVALLILGVGMNVADGNYTLAALLTVGALVNGVQLYQLRRMRRQLQRLSAEDPIDRTS
jgi:hypothetical protein